MNKHQTGRLFLSCAGCLSAVVLLRSLPACAGEVSAGTDASNAWAYAENAGWVNAAPTNAGLTVHFDGSSGWLGGYLWSENAGWIKLGDTTGGPYGNNSAADWGVNMDGSGKLSGYAWGENIGWINFAPTYGGVSINPTNGWLSGQAWAENMGWLTFSGSTPAFGVRTLAFDAQPLGTPNWWLLHYGITEAFDEGDAIPAWKEYVADTDPTDALSFLRVTSLSNAPSSIQVTFAPSSTRRYYTLLRRTDLQTDLKTPVPGQAGLAGSGGTQTLTDTNAFSSAFYSIKVTVAPE